MDALETILHTGLFRLKTLEQVVENWKSWEGVVEGLYGTSAWVERAGWRNLYIRVGCRTIPTRGSLYERVGFAITLANLEAEKPRTGAFKSLVADCIRDYPEAWLVVESVINPHLADYLHETTDFWTTTADLESACPTFYRRPDGRPR